jgi:hypothetical protein
LSSATSSGRLVGQQLDQGLAVGRRGYRTVLDKQAVGLDYEDLACHLELAAAAASRRTRLRKVARACRAWGLVQPNTYRLIFESTAGSGQDLTGFDPPLLSEEELTRLEAGAGQ